MKTIELKEKLKQRINEIDDNSLLQGIYDMVRKEGEVYELSEEQKVRIIKAKQEIKEGKTTSNKDFQKELNEWFTKEKQSQ